MNTARSIYSSTATADSIARPTYTLPHLPYDRGALAPVISASTVDVHYGKHHKGYVDNLNKLVEASRYRDLPLETIIVESARRAEQIATYHNAAQVWNHNFYWRSLRPGGGGTPPAILRQQIEDSFGSVAECRRQWAALATSQFGSGWTWLVVNRNRIELLKTANADGPLTLGVRGLLVIDVWEHAYYLDYQNRRAEYVNAVFDSLIDWSFAMDNFG